MRVTAIQDTSVMSYSQLKEEGSLGAQQDLVLKTIKQSGTDMSIGEISAATGLQKSSVSGRVKELIEAEVVVIAPRRADRISGRLVRPVRLAPVQLGFGHGY